MNFGQKMATLKKSRSVVGNGIVKGGKFATPKTPAIKVIGKTSMPGTKTPAIPKVMAPVSPIAPKSVLPMQKKKAKKAGVKTTGSFDGKSNKLGQGGRAKQLEAKGVPGGVIGNLARAAHAAPGQANYHKAQKAYMKRVGTN